MGISNSGRKYDIVRKIWIDHQYESLVVVALKWKEKVRNVYCDYCQVEPGEILELVYTLRV